MTVLAPGMSLFLRCVGDAQHPGNRMLNGDTIRGAVTLEADTSVPWSGTRWFVVDGGAGLVALQCLGDLAGSRFLNGHTNDGAAGTLDLAPTTEGGLTGTRWQAAEDGAGGLTLQCMGSDRNENFQLLDGRTSEGIVRLAPSTDGGFTGTHWTPVEIVDHTTTPASLNGPALTFGVDGPNVFGVAMAWTGFDGRVNVQRLVGGGAEDVTMLVDTAIDRPGKKVLPDTSIDGPALAWREDFNSGLEPELVLGWTGRPGGPDGDNHLNIAFSETGVGDWQGKTTIASTSGRGPRTDLFQRNRRSRPGRHLHGVDREASVTRIDTHDFLDLPVIPT